MKNKDRLFLDVHALQTVPPSCVNRDDTGSPKSAIYGGAVRARVSSQSWKRAMRKKFPELISLNNLGFRTKYVLDLVAKEINKIEQIENAEEVAKVVLDASGFKVKTNDDNENQKADALFFISTAQANALAKIAVANKTNQLSKEAVKEAKEALRSNPSIDMALFGRMLAGDTSLTVDACAQVAHSISTHKVQREYDYFTAVDDMPHNDKPGASHIDTVEFNSATLYRYATVAVHELQKYLEGETSEAVCAFIKAFVYSMPTGRQNAFAHQTVPNCLLVTLRSDQPVNFVGAFEKPVQSGKNNDQGYVQSSADALVTHAKKVQEHWLAEPNKTWVTGELLKELGEPMSLNKVIDALETEINDYVMLGGVQ